MPRKLLIIQPSHYRSETCREIVKVRRRQLVPLTLAYLAALTPSDWEVKLVDELVEDVDFDSPADVVALTLWTANSLRGYDVAAAFRARGVPVILGGAHTFFPCRGSCPARRCSRRGRRRSHLAANARRCRACRRQGEFCRSRPAPRFRQCRLSAVFAAATGHVEDRDRRRRVFAGN